MADDAGKNSDGSNNEAPSLDDFSERLERLRGETADPAAKRPKPVAGKELGRALRISTELVAGLLVGTLLGIMIDRWTGMAPLFLFIGIGVGFAAGMRNLSRSMSQDNLNEDAQGADDKNENG